MNLDLSSLNIFSPVVSWLAQHGMRVLLILTAAIVADLFIKAAIAKKSFGWLVVDERLRRRLHEKISAGQKKRIRTIANVLNGIVAFSIYVIAILMILPEFGVNIAPILAGLGLVGLAASFAARDILSDFIAGFYIIIEDQYRIGDYIAAAGTKGRVTEITLRRTIIEGDDGAINLIPNREVKVVTRNLSGPGN